jgi:hypothetical protein
LTRARARRPDPLSPSASSSPQVKDIGSGNFGVAKLMRDKRTGAQVAVKFIERGDKVRGGRRRRAAAAATAPRRWLF